MDQESNITPSAIPDGAEDEVVSMLKKLQQQLLFLEKKVDLLISQSKERPHGDRAVTDRPFRKRPFTNRVHASEYPRHRPKGEQRSSPSESDSARGHFYEHHLRGKSHGPIPKRKPISYKRKDED
jgi:hypothetical protein